MTIIQSIGGNIGILHQVSSSRDCIILPLHVADQELLLLIATICIAIVASN